MRILIVERYPFKGIKNNFIDSLLYQDFLEIDENPHPDEPDSGNEADKQPEEDECLWKINPLVMSIDKLDFNTTANVKDEWFINENQNLAYFSAFAFDTVPSDTSTDIDIGFWSVMNALTSLHAPTKSSLMVREEIRDELKALFEVPTKLEGPKPILFGRIKSESIAYESSGGNSESPQFFHYEQNSRHMM